MSPSEVIPFLLPIKYKAQLTSFLAKQCNANSQQRDNVDINERSSSGEMKEREICMEEGIYLSRWCEDQLTITSSTSQGGEGMLCPEIKTEAAFLEIKNNLSIVIQAYYDQTNSNREHIKRELTIVKSMIGNSGILDV